MKGRTTFVIAHRLSTIRRADQILVVENGLIVEHGTHETLYAARGRYWDMYTKQHGLESNLFLAPGEGDPKPRETGEESPEVRAGPRGSRRHAAPPQWLTSRRRARGAFPSSLSLAVVALPVHRESLSRRPTGRRSSRNLWGSSSRAGPVSAGCLPPTRRLPRSRRRTTRNTGCSRPSCLFPAWAPRGPSAGSIGAAGVDALTALTWSAGVLLAGLAFGWLVRVLQPGRDGAVGGGVRRGDLSLAVRGGFVRRAVRGRGSRGGSGAPPLGPLALPRRRPVGGRVSSQADPVGDDAGARRSSIVLDARSLRGGGRALRAMGVFAAALCLHAAANRLLYGSFFESGYGDEMLRFTTPIGTGLFGLLLSPGRGLLLYAPVVVAGVLGLRVAPRAAVLALRGSAAPAPSRRRALVELGGRHGVGPAAPPAGASAPRRSRGARRGGGGACRVRRGSAGQSPRRPDRAGSVGRIRRGAPSARGRRVAGAPGPCAFRRFPPSLPSWATPGSPPGTSRGSSSTAPG